MTPFTGLLKRVEIKATQSLNARRRLSEAAWKSLADIDLVLSEISEIEGVVSPQQDIGFHTTPAIENQEPHHRKRGRKPSQRLDHESEFNRSPYGAELLVVLKSLGGSADKSIVAEKVEKIVSSRLPSSELERKFGDLVWRKRLRMTVFRLKSIGLMQAKGRLWSLSPLACENLLGVKETVVDSSESTLEFLAISEYERAIREVLSSQDGISTPQLRQEVFSMLSGLLKSGDLVFSAGQENFFQIFDDVKAGMVSRGEIETIINPVGQKITRLVNKGI